MARDPEEMPEAELQREVLQLADELGVLHFHAHESRRDVPGWPDLVLWGRGGLIFRELKSTQGRVSREQQHVGNSLGGAGQDWAVWRPHDLHSGRIRRDLTRIAQPPKIYPLRKES